MQKDSYIVLGLEENATLQDLERAYTNLKEKYQKLCFEEGEVGSSAAKMLSKIRIAYNDCLEDIKKRDFLGEKTEYEAIQDLIKQGKLNEAQLLLDNTEPRDGEWHFVQAHIFYKRNWFLESKSQVEMALMHDPDNDKYKATMMALNKKQSAGDDEIKAQRQSRAGYSTPKEVGGSMMNGGLCSYCLTMLACNAMCYFCI